MNASTRVRRRQTRALIHALATALALAGGCGQSDEDAALPDCAEGSCEPAPCAPPFADTCAGGCVDLSSDPAFCGACDRACGAGEFCVAGECETECGATAPTPCGSRCVDPRTDPAHCGGCDRPCAEGERCSGGRCDATCGAETPDACGALCVDLQSDPRFCGSCEGRCADGEVCVEGECAGECSGSRPLRCGHVCVDPRTDPRFCGGCDAPCPLGEVCNDGHCESQCSGATPVLCDGLCVDGTSSPIACGGCGVLCKAGAVCAGGTCAATCRDPSRVACGDVCVDLATDPNHCGSCGIVCGAGAVCSESACGAECGGATPIRCGARCVRADAADGCGTCPSSAPDACAAGCVDLASDREHCGACDRACDADADCVEGRCETDAGPDPGSAGAGGIAECEGPSIEPCGACGTRTRSCDRGEWSPWSDCAGEGVCAPDASEVCGNQGTRTCSAACAWNECQGQSCDGPAQRPCGNCGTESRTCDNGVWSDWSGCSGEGVCAPNASDACVPAFFRFCSHTCGWCACEDVSQIPILTTPEGPNGTVFSSGDLDGTYPAWHAFDGPQNLWISAVGVTPAILGYAFGDATRFVTRYAIHFANGDLTSRAPKNWTFEGRNDADWIVLDTRESTGWGGNERREFQVTTPGSYREYRLNVTDDNDPRPAVEVISITSFELFGAICP